MIRTLDLHIGYEQTLLKVEDLQLQPGVSILIGKNGSGKSTFLKTISGQLPPISGTITLNGQSISTLSVSELPKHIAFVSSRFPEIDFLRVHEYIALGRSPHTSYFGKLSEKDKKAVEDAIAIIGIEHLRDRFTNELSDGERQLVAITRAFAQGTSVIILDEPTAFLDYLNKAAVLQKLIELGRAHGKCIVLSSHDIDQSLETGCPFLVVNHQNRFLSLLTNSNKESLIQMAFQI